jgi:hypothetical protein
MFLWIKVVVLNQLRWFTPIPNYLEAAQAKSYQDPILKNKPGVVVHICNASYSGGRDKRILVRGQPWERPFLKNKLSQKSCGCVSTSRLLA